MPSHRLGRESQLRSHLIASTPDDEKLEHSLLLLGQSCVVVVTMEDPPEDAEPWLPAPAVLVAVARKETGCLPGAVVQGQRDITEYQGSGGLLHAYEPRSASSSGQDRRSPSRSIPTSTARTTRFSSQSIRSSAKVRLPGLPQTCRSCRLARRRASAGSSAPRYGRSVRGRPGTPGLGAQVRRALALGAIVFGGQAIWAAFLENWVRVILGAVIAAICLYGLYRRRSAHI